MAQIIGLKARGRKNEERERTRASEERKIQRRRT